MNQKLQSVLLRKKHPYSFLFSMLYMGAAIAVCSRLLPENIIAIPLLFALSIIIALVSDMAIQLAIQKSLLAERDQLLSENELEKMRANLLRAISHDLRSPLIGIINSSSLILEQGTCLAEAEKQRLIVNICEDSTWLLHMVENLLTITRIQDNERPLSIITSEESVEEVVSEALQKLSLRYPDEQIQAEVPEKLILLPMDAILIEQVIINLLTNAIVHAHSTRPIEIIVSDSFQAVIFTVRDYGTGLPTENMNHLFDGVLRTPARPDNRGKGSGIGLSICKTIIAAHHGTLHGKNHAEGAEFTFTLPKNQS
ncbi:MAG: ATP-binding protein [Candidatus Gastranaerophilales bacterium]|nr:ATP-binding protein [Candidatus Gastranaerophilales bacterium]